MSGTSSLLSDQNHSTPGSWQLASTVLQLVMGDTNSKDARIWLVYSFRCLGAKVSISCGSRRCNWLAARMRKTDR
jgi:hypothetical protein